MRAIVMRSVLLLWVALGVTSGRLLAGAPQTPPGFALDNGDVNGDGARDLIDGVSLLRFIFLGGPGPVPLALCEGNPPAVKNGDIDGNGKIQLPDALRLLGWLFFHAHAPVLACPPGEDGFRVIGPQDIAYGLSYGDWAAAWWQWALGIPAAQNPEEDTTGQYAGVGQSGPVWFLGATFGDLGSNVVRTFAIPGDKTLILPVYPWIFGACAGDCDPSNPGVACDVPALRDAAAAAATSIQTMEVSIDGVPVPGVRNYRTISPSSFSVTLPADNVLQFLGLSSDVAGTYAPQVADGYWLILAPLTPGTHTIGVHLIPDPRFGAEQGITYRINVQ